MKFVRLRILYTQNFDVYVKIRFIQEIFRFENFLHIMQSFEVRHFENVDVSQNFNVIISKSQIHVVKLRHQSFDAFSRRLSEINE